MNMKLTCGEFVGLAYANDDELREFTEEILAENAKLRELVDAWMGCGTRYHTMQGACPMFDADAEDFCKAASIACELGIEVD